MWRKLIQPHSIIVTILIFVFIWFVDSIRLNLHFLDPFNNGIRDYEITDIVYSQLRSQGGNFEDRIVLVNTGRPDRQTLLRMVDRVAAAGPRVIGLDIFLSDHSDSSDVDRQLRENLRRAGNIVLATRLEGYREDLGVFETETGCDTFFCDYTSTGFANFPANDTRTIRFFSPREKTEAGESISFAVEIARQYDIEALKKFFARNKPLERIHYTSDADDYVLFEPENLLDSTVDLRPTLEGRIVLLGYIGTYSWDEPLLDRYFTPLNPRYTGRTIPDMYGVVIHANIIRMILDGHYIREIPGWLSFLLAVFFCYANVLVIHRIYRRFNQAFHGMTRILQMLEFVVIFFLIAVLFHYFRIKFDFGLGILALLLAYDIIMIYESLIRNRLPILRRIPDKWPVREKRVTSD